MMCSHCRSNIFTGCLNELHGIGGGDVLEHDPERWERADDGRERGVDERLFAIKYIHMMIGHFTVYQQWHIMLFHRLENGIQCLDARDAGI